MLLNFVQKKKGYAIPLTMLLGIVYGMFFDASALKKAIVPLSIFMVYPMMVTMNFRFRVVKENAKVFWVGQMVNFILIPIIGAIVGKLFFAKEPYMQLGVVLIALIPTSGMPLSWIGFAKGNVPGAAKPSVFSLLLGLLLAPFYLKLIMDKAIELPFYSLVKQLIIVAYIPMIFGYFTQRLLIQRFGEEPFQKIYKPMFPPKATWGVLGVVFIAMALKAQTIVANPVLLLSILAAVLLFYAFVYIVSVSIGHVFFHREKAIALTLGTAMRNHSIALALAMTVFLEEGGEMALLIALALFVQVQSATWYVNFAQKPFLLSLSNKKLR